MQFIKAKKIDTKRLKWPVNDLIKVEGNFHAAAKWKTENLIKDSLMRFMKLIKLLR